MSEGPFAPFVPAILAERLVRTGREVAGPDGWRTAGVVLVIDITGFTALTERLVERGPGGAETLASILNLSFGDVIERIHAHGGDVVHFAGDAILAVWPRAAEDLADAVVAAATCALEAQRLLEARPPVEEVHVRARAGIAVGDMWVGIVGGVGDEWRWVVGGPPLGGAAAAAAQARPGELVVTADAAAAGGLSGPSAGADPGHVVIADLDTPAPATDRATADVREVEQPAPLPAEEILATFLPRVLVSRVRAGQTDWLAEFRRLTVVFVGIRGFDGGAPGALTFAQTAFRAAQTLIDRYGGSLNQIVDDDKGLTLVAAWGFPDRTHEDDPARGVLAARAIVDALGELGLDVSAGVSTGRAFTGVRGGQIRCEYAMVGDVVNLAARLMQSGSSAARTTAGGGPVSGEGRRSRGDRSPYAR